MFHCGLLNSMTHYHVYRSVRSCAVIRKICGYRFCNVMATCVLLYSAVHGFWLVVDSVELAEGPAGCGCLFAWNCS
jgi:hypothetical protein